MIKKFSWYPLNNISDVKTGAKKLAKTGCIVVLELMWYGTGLLGTCTVHKKMHLDHWEFSHSTCFHYSIDKYRVQGREYRAHIKRCIWPPGICHLALKWKWGLRISRNFFIGFIGIYHYDENLKKKYLEMPSKLKSYGMQAICVTKNTSIHVQRINL